ncbi:uncharacterized protein BXZ73DRAFT_110589 [Epithele typhae]|uniref:uncharacterized protein n=1 Tax=Epithele typhae TaxID=378194 RepID=UPI0020088EBB|nr:uncharacterized protein BXZ73DRAFT_110589 [Epithele typhae]KAH9906122.1 hypothetical protein BXZ73DRAFT_110589 [Epithele typhae]
MLEQWSNGDDVVQLPVFESAGITVAVLFSETCDRHIGLLLHPSTALMQDAARPKYHVGHGFRRANGSLCVHQLVALCADWHAFEFNGERAHYTLPPAVWDSILLRRCAYNQHKFLCRHFNAETALLYNTGYYNAYFSFWKSVVQVDDINLLDELTPTSLRDGIIISRRRNPRYVLALKDAGTLRDVLVCHLRLHKCVHTIMHSFSKGWDMLGGTLVFSPASTPTTATPHELQFRGTASSMFSFPEPRQLIPTLATVEWHPSTASYVASVISMGRVPSTDDRPTFYAPSVRRDL